MANFIKFAIVLSSFILLLNALSLISVASYFVVLTEGLPGRRAAIFLLYFFPILGLLATAMVIYSFRRLWVAIDNP